jgi:hypothetical protein
MTARKRRSQIPVPPTRGDHLPKAKQPMRTTALIQLRGTMAEIMARLPESLKFLAPPLAETKSGKAVFAYSEALRAEPPALRAVGPDRVVGRLKLEPSELAELVRWGRQRVAGKTLLRVARLDEHYDRVELDGSKMAELYGDYELYKHTDTKGEPPKVVNMRSALRGRWDCGWCGRVRLEQVGPLKVRPASGGIDVQVTDTWHLLMARRLAPVAEHAGAEVRGLAGRSDFVQVVTPAVVTVRPVFPLFQVEAPCPGCGRVGYDRSDQVEGCLSFGADDDGLTVAKEWPLTLEVTDAPAATCRERIGCRWYYREGSHQVGAEFNLMRESTWTSGSYAVFLGLPFVDALLAQGASKLSLRPVNGIDSTIAPQANSPLADG